MKSHSIEILYDYSVFQNNPGGLKQPWWQMRLICKFQRSSVVVNFGYRQAWNISFLCWMSRLTLRVRVKSSDIQKEWNTLWQWNPVGCGPCWMPPCGGIPVKSNWEDTWSRLRKHHTLGLGMLQCSPKTSWWKWLGKGSCGLLCLGCYLRAPDTDKQQEIHGWVIKLYTLLFS